jgi:hypothetical protein
MSISILMSVSMPMSMSISMLHEHEQGHVAQTYSTEMLHGHGNLHRCVHRHGQGQRHRHRQVLVQKVALKGTVA